MARSLDCNGKRSLMLCTVACDSSREDLSSLRDVLFQLCHVFVINLVIFFSAEYAYFFPSAYRASSLEAALRSASLFVSHLPLPPEFIASAWTAIRIG